MYSEADPRYMQHALQLAARALLHATPNPRVGCVIVRDGHVLGEGVTQPPGHNHAEIEALLDARRQGHDVAGATAYVTLEPCAHFGRTPPCATALIEARLARVVAAVEDPNPLVSGRGMDMLREAGIDVRCGLLRQEAIEANLGFFSRMNRGRPWVRVKLAASLDGRTALENGASQWITGEAARTDGHNWRARSCAILTGIGTVLADDPRLSVHRVATPRQPLKVVVDSTLRLSPEARLLDGGPVIVACARAAEGRTEALERKGAQLLVVPAEDGRVDLAALFKALAEGGINEVHVEAGGVLSGALVRAGLADELLVYLAPTLLGPGRDMVELPLIQDLANAQRLRFQDVTLLDGDVRLLARIA